MRYADFNFKHESAFAESVLSISAIKEYLERNVERRRRYEMMERFLREHYLFETSKRLTGRFRNRVVSVGDVLL